MRASNLSELPIICDFCILGKKVVFGDPDVSEIHKAIFLGRETKFGSNITAFNARQPVEVLVFDLDQEWVDSIVFSLDHSLCKHNGIVGNEGELTHPILCR